MTPKQLKIEFTERHKDFVIQQLARMYTPKEVTSMVLMEFDIEWELSATDPQRVTRIRQYVYKRVRDYAYDSRNGKIQQRIVEVREEWKRELEREIREANKEFRVQEYARIKERCLADGDHRTAIRALQAIKNELEGVHFTVEHTHGIRTESQIDKDIEEIIEGSNIPSEVVAGFIDTVAASALVEVDGRETKASVLSKKSNGMGGRKTRRKKGNS